jgi:hypothetical protein
MARKTSPNTAITEAVDVAVDAGGVMAAGTTTVDTTITKETDNGAKANVLEPSV